MNLLEKIFIQVSSAKISKIVKILKAGDGIIYFSFRTPLNGSLLDVFWSINLPVEVSRFTHESVLGL